MTERQSTLDCQDCGDVVRTLTNAEALDVADRPYDFVVYCFPCRRDRMKEMQDGSM